MARECGFCRRERVINIYDFFKMLLHCANLQQCSSLSYMSSFLEIEHNTKVSKEAINKRFTENCVQFVEAVWGEVLKERYKDFLCSYGDNIFRSFNRVRIKDSTKFQLPDAMKADFPGTGGCASAAGVSIQFEYDIKSGTILYLKICPGTMNDHQDAADTCLDVERDDLIIRDLGYFSRDVLRVFVEKGAYFLSRLDSQTVVVEKKGRKRLNFDKLYKDMQKGGIIRKEITVLIGSSNQLEVRLIVELVPDCVYEQRLRHFIAYRQSSSPLPDTLASGADIQILEKYFPCRQVSAYEERALPVFALCQAYTYCHKSASDISRTGSHTT